MDATTLTTYPSIDVVYTWVNGTDPVWLAKKLHYSEMHIRELGKDIHDSGSGKEVKIRRANNNTYVNSTINNFSIAGDQDFVVVNSSNSTNITTNATLDEAQDEMEQQQEDDTMSENRYRDSDELRYSLRSLTRYAPWIRHIYIVTDNQIPNWLNLRHPRLTMISHSDIFQNKSHLPVFSSPAIETHLHRIKGISKRFIYFNDDVFLGADVLPDDFFALDASHKFRFAWDVPKCSPGCVDSWIGDGFCDKACNVSACDFDFPDCVNATDGRRGGRDRDRSRANRDRDQHVVMCSKGCPTNWLADRVCDVRCDNKVLNL